MTPSFHRVLALTCLTALIAAAGPVYAASTEEQRRIEIQEALKIKQAEHDALSKQAQKIDKEVKTLRTKLVETSSALRKTEENLNKTEDKLKKLRSGKKKLSDDLFRDQGDLGGLVTAAGRYKRTTVPQMLVQSDPITAARAALVMHDVIPFLQNRSSKTREQLAGLEKIEADIAQQLKEQSRELKKMNAQQDDLGDLIKERQTIYKKTESARMALEEDMRNLAAEAQNLDDLVLKINKRSRQRQADEDRDAEDTDSRTIAAAPLPANMRAPVQGSIRTVFGGTTETGSRSKGITFNTRSGSMVVTPLAGTVRFAGPFQKYKQILIVEHRGGYHSLIAGLGSINTVVGARLSAGEPVGRADDIGSTIYYELRQNGTPIDPKRLLMARQ